MTKEMKKIDLNTPIKNLSGDDIENSHMGELLGNVLVGQTKGEALKYYDWACMMHKHNVFEIDRADFDKILKFVQETDSLPVLSKAQIELRLKEVNQPKKEEAKTESPK